MPIPQELADKINNDLELGAQPQDIVYSIMNGEKYPDLAEKMRADAMAGLSHDDIFTRLRKSEIVPAAPSIWQRIKQAVTPAPAPIATVPAHEVTPAPKPAGLSIFQPMPGVTMEELQGAGDVVPEAASAAGTAVKNLPLAIAKGIGSRVEMLGDVAGAMRVNPQMPEVDVTEQVDRATGGLPTGDNLISKLGREAAETHGDILKAATPEFKSPIAKHIYSAAMSAGETLSTLPASIVIPGSSLLLMGSGSGANEYHDLVKSGVAKPKAAAGGAVNAGIEIITEKLPLDYLTKNLGQSFKKYLMGMMVREVPTELAAAAGQEAENAWATSTTLGEAIKKYKQRIGPALADTAIQTPISAGMQAGGVRGAVRAVDIINQMKQGRAQEPAAAASAQPQPEAMAAAKPVSPAVSVEAVKTPPAQKAMSPLEFAKEHVLQGNEAEGLSPDAVERIARNMAFDAGMPGFYRKEYIRPYADRAVSHARETGEEVSRTHIDIGNLTGINNAKGHEAANKDIREIADIIKRTFEQYAPVEKLDFGREGGDEMSVYGRGVSKATLDMAAQAATMRVKEYARGNGLLQLPSKRGVPEDVSLHTHTASVNEFFRSNPEATTQDFLTYNDAKLAKQGEQKYVTGSQTREVGAIAPEGQAAGAERSLRPDNQQVRTEAPAATPAVPPAAEVAPAGRDYQPLSVSEQDKHLLTFMQSGIDAGRPGERGPVDYDNPDPALRNKPKWSQNSTYPGWFAGLKRDDYLPLIEKALRGEALTSIQRKDLAELMDAARADYHRSLSQAEKDVPTLDLDEGDTVMKRRETDGELDTFKVLSNDGKTVRLKDGITEEHPVDFGETIPAIEVKKAEGGQEPKTAYDLIQEKKTGGITDTEETAQPDTARSFSLSASEIIEQKKGKPEQAGLDLETTGADLRAPERENMPVSMDELPLGKATNEAADRERQSAFDIIQEKKAGAKPEEEATVKESLTVEDKSPLEGIENDISRSLATRAFEGTSHSPESRGALRIKEYVEIMRSDYEELSQLADTPEKKEYLDREFPEYRRKYADKFRAYLSAHSNVMSSFIVGPAKFPVERMRKRSDTADRRANEAEEFRKKAFARMRNEIAPAEAKFISSDDPGAVEKLKEKLGALEKRQERMKSINNAHKKYLKQGDAALEGLSEEDQHLIKNYKPAYSWEPHPFAPYELSNNNANIKNVQERIAALEKSKAVPTNEREAEGVRVVDNADDNRIQIFYPGKPDAATIIKLKKHGFKWAPSVKAWQRQRTDNARYAAKEVTGIDLSGKIEPAGGEAESTVMLHSFPGNVRKGYDWIFDQIGKGLGGIARFGGKHSYPWMKDMIGKAMGLPNFTAGGNDPYRKPIVDLNNDRAEQRTAQAYNIFNPDTDSGYEGAKATMLRGQDRKDFDEIAWKGDALWQTGEVDYKPGDMTTTKNPTGRTVSQDSIDAYLTNREMLRREQKTIIEDTQRIALAPYERTDNHAKLSRIMEDLLQLDTKDKRDVYYAKLLKGGGMPGDLQRAAFKIRKYVELIADYQGVFKAHPWYMPRVRPDGEFVVRGYDRSLRDAKGKPALVYTATAKTEAGAEKLKKDFKQNAREVLKVHFDPNGQYTASWDRNKQLSEDIYQGLGAKDNIEAVIRQAVEKLEGKGRISNAEADALDAALYETLAEVLAVRGAGKHFIRRSESLIEGYETENLAEKMVSQVSGIVGWLSKAEYSIRGLEAIKDIPTNRPSDLTWTHNYFADSLRNSGTGDRIFARASGLATVWYMGLDLVDAVQNSMQHYLTAIPEMSRFTNSNVAIMEGARKDIITRHLTEFDKRVLADAVRTGIGQAQYIQDLEGTAESGPSQSKSKIVRFISRWVQKGVRAAMTPFRLVEQFLNREPAYLAAMRLFTGAKDAKGNYYGLQKNGKPYKMSFDEAMQKARQFVNDTHYVMGKANRPELARKVDTTLPGLGSAAYKFAGFSHNYFHWLFTRATSGQSGDFGAAARSLFVLWALGGASALPLIADFDDWARKLWGAMPLHKLKLEIRTHLEEYAGGPSETVDGVTDIIMHGLPTYAGVDFSKKAAVGVPILSGDNRDVFGRIFGPWYGLGKKFGQGMQAAARGDSMRAVEKFMPQFAEHAMSGYRMTTKGATSLHGKAVLDEKGRPVKLTPGEGVLKGVGGQPQRLSKIQEADAAKWDLQKYWSDRRQTLIDRYRIAKGADRADVVKEIKDFNEEVQDDKEAKLIVAPISAYSMIQSIMQKPNIGTAKEGKFKEEMVR